MGDVQPSVNIWLLTSPGGKDEPKLAESSRETGGSSGRQRTEQKVQVFKTMDVFF